MKNRIIGVIGGLMVLIGMISPWLINLEGKTFYGFNFFGLNTAFNSLLIITIILSLIAIILSLIEKKTAGIFLLIIGVLLTGWGIVLKFAIRSFGISYIWEKYGAEWLGETVSTFLNMGWGIYVVTIGGILIFAEGVLKLKAEFLTGVIQRIKERIGKINRKTKIRILIGILIIVLIPIGRNWFQKQRQEQFLDYREEAVEKQDPTICEKIKAEGTRDHCYKDVGVLKEDLLICDKIQSRVIRDLCYEDVAEKKQDPNICESIEDRGSRGSCYHRVAVAKQDPALCEKMGFIQSYIEECYRNIAKETKNLNLCEKITFQNIKSLCYTDIAVVTKDPSICERYEVDKTLCYRQVAEATNDPELCEKVKTQPFRDFCFENIAEEIKSLKLCEKIEDQSTKERCYRKIEER